jgi:site-specific recombinase XerD
MGKLAVRDKEIEPGKVFDLLDVREATRQDYRARIGLYVDFVTGQGFNHNSYLEFKRHLSARTDIGIATKNKYLITARIFLKELHRQGVIPVDITQNIKGFTQNKKHKRDGLSEDEIALLANKMKDLPSTPTNTRLKALLGLLTLQGLRQVEIVRLDVRDLDLTQGTARIQGKGRDDKELIHLHPETVRTLKEYLKSNTIADGPLFQSRSNNNRHKRITTRAVRLIVTAALRDLGIDKNVHGFRHYFTTKLIKTYKGDLLEVCRYTRHTGLEMLQVYNDGIKQKADLPRYYSAFSGVSFT